jgi:hypothetical protein
MNWYRVVLQCEGCPTEAGQDAARDIAAAFKARDWHKNVTCVWDGALLTLTSENDFDDSGRATMDEFSHEISANVSEGFDGDILIVSVTPIAPPA